ncbi:MAG: hypothetical protein KGR23_04145 [Betaproteobacteria bacterium]|nr:hypothetical protein [Betaproteobacteria bacterium]
MKCRICKSATLPGERLCGPCRAALNRARHAGAAAAALDASTVTADIGGAIPPRDSRDGVDAGAGTGSKLRRWPAVVMIASVITAAAAYTWLGNGVEHRPTVAAANPTPSSVAAPDAGQHRIEAAAPAPAAEAVAGAAAQPTLYLRRRDSVGPRLAAVPRKAPRPDVAADAQANSAPRVDAATVYDAGGAGTPAAIAANPKDTRQTRASPGDRLQALDDALAQCSGNFIERIVCGQRARFRFCDGYWGRVPQCPSGAVADNR